MRVLEDVEDASRRCLQTSWLRVSPPSRLPGRGHDPAPCDVPPPPPPLARVLTTVPDLRLSEARRATSSRRSIWDVDRPRQ